MVPSENLDGRTAIITGASAGIGKATAHRLAEAGTNVVLAARRKDRLETLAEAIRESGGTASVVKTDVTVEDDVKNLVDTTIEEYGQIDIAVANAGIGLGGSVAELDTEDYHKMMDVNTDGVFFLTHEAIPHLVESEGNLVFVGSFAGEFPRPVNPVYAATKWWVRGFGKSVMAEIGEDNVAVSIVNPSEVRTEFLGQDAEAYKDRFEPGSVTEPEEIAEAIAFAASQDHSTAAEIDLFRRDKFSGL